MPTPKKPVAKKTAAAKLDKKAKERRKAWVDGYDRGFSNKKDNLTAKANKKPVLPKTSNPKIKDIITGRDTQMSRWDKENSIKIAEQWEKGYRAGKRSATNAAKSRTGKGRVNRGD